MHAPSVADPFENAVRALVKSRLARGHVEVRISLPPGAVNGTPAALNRDLLEEYLDAFRQAAAEHGLDVQPDLNAALRIPGMFGEAAEGAELPAGTEAAMLDALSAALDELNQFRAREGAEIAQEMSGHNTPAWRARRGDGKIRANAQDVFQNRLAERLKDLLKGVQVDPQRLAQEAAILADRSDIGEELARLKIHAGQLAALLDGRRRSRQEARFPAAGDEPRDQYHPVQDQRRGRNRPQDHGTGAGREGGDRKNPRAILKP